MNLKCFFGLHKWDLVATYGVNCNHGWITRFEALIGLLKCDNCSKLKLKIIEISNEKKECDD